LTSAIALSPCPRQCWRGRPSRTICQPRPTRQHARIPNQPTRRYARNQHQVCAVAPCPDWCWRSSPTRTICTPDSEKKVRQKSETKVHQQAKRGYTKKREEGTPTTNTSGDPVKMILSTLGDATRAAPASPKPVTVRQRSGLCPQAFSTSLMIAVKYLYTENRKTIARTSEMRASRERVAAALLRCGGDSRRGERSNVPTIYWYRFFAEHRSSDPYMPLELALAPAATYAHVYLTAPRIFEWGTGHKACIGSAFAEESTSPKLRKTSEEEQAFFVR